MFEIEFADTALWKKEKRVEQLEPSSLKAGDVAAVQLLYWREHCLECAPPDCYHTCSRYAPRLDKRCVRFTYGIYPNTSFSGLFGFGADLRFLPWAKIGTDIYGCALTPGAQKRVMTIDALFSKFVNLLFSITDPFNPYTRFKIRSKNPQGLLHKTSSYVREKSLRVISRLCTKVKLDCFVLECYSAEQKAFQLQLEYSESEPLFRHSFKIQPGKNYFEIPLEKFNTSSNPPSGSLILYPENDAEVRVVFTWFDFVRKKKREAVDGTAPQRPVPAKKVKCLAWDLDNTLWKGVLIEDGEKGLRVSEEIVEVIRRLDERGIIQTVVSKNSHDEAWEVITRSGLDEYFLYPAINWGTKSSNLKQIADRLNINIDTFALIDDSKFERGEVGAQLPQVRLYDETEFSALLGYPEFDNPVTESSRNRRKSYLSEVNRQQVVEEFDNDKESFLRHCKIEMRIFIPEEKKDIDRCLELIQRSNQLNLSTRRYSATDFTALLDSAEKLSLALHCKDRYGDYGIVGFACIDEGAEQPAVIDFVISCRIAQKTVEDTFFRWLSLFEAGKGRPEIRVKLIKTERNGPLMRVFDNLPFEVIEEREGVTSMRLLSSSIAGNESVIEVTAKV